MKLQDTLRDMGKDDILKKLKEDEHYYGEFGQQFLSNSSIYTLVNNPRDFREPTKPSVPLLIGGAFHTMVLEPHKMDKYDVVDASSRSTKIYKEAADGEMKLLRSDYLKLEEMQQEMDGNETVHDILRGDQVEYEVPAIMEICGEMWKGKADVLNHRDGILIDIKTTADITKFHNSARRYNYDSQAYIYNQLFGYDVLFIVIDKSTYQLGLYDCSPQFYQAGRDKVIEAVQSYRLYYKDQEGTPYDWNNYLLTETL